MRYIEPDLHSLPEAWQVRASTERDLIRDAQAIGAEELRAALAHAQAVWAAAKDQLGARGHEKCWYCEMPQERSDKAVDHFRPKGRVAEDPTHPGYWWLAVDESNFRYSCTYCNSRRVGVDTSGGKQDHFPLMDPSARARGPADDIDLEANVLLDPCDPSDPPLLTFGLDGKPATNSVLAPNGSVDSERVAASVHFYHLDHRGICDRRLMLNRDLKRQLDSAERWFAAARAGDANAKKSVRDALNAIKEALRPSAALSAAARAYVRGQRSNDAVRTAILELLGV